MGKRACGAGKPHHTGFMDKRIDEGRPPARSRVRSLALLCAVLALLVVASSAYLRLHKTGVGCTPWPQCQAAATAQPPQADTFTAGARLLHRMAAAAMLVAVLLIVAGSVPPRGTPQQAREAFALLAVVVALAVLGVFTAGSRAPAVALGNVLGGFVMLGLSAWLALPAGSRRWLPPWVLALAALQLVAGAASSVLQAAWQPGRAGLLGLHIAGAVLLAAALAAGVRRAAAARRPEAGLAAALLAAQLALGVALWLGRLALPLGAAWLHNIAAAALLVLVVRAVR
jgi:cytochrome c oxidase assembly protein subunit 15